MKTIRSLDKISFADWFRSHGGSNGSIKRMWNPIAYALGFIDCENISARCMLTIFQMFAARSEASVLRMLEGSPDEYLHKPIIKYLEAKRAKIHTRRRVREIQFSGEGVETRVTGLVVAKGETEEIIKADAYVCACDVPGIQRVLPQAWREWSEFDNIYKLDTVPVATVQLRFDGWVTELQDTAERRQLDHAAG
jgi:zeta-carotene desaturase